VKLGTAIRIAAVIATGALLGLFAAVYGSNCEQDCGSEFAWAAWFAAFGTVAGLLAMFGTRRGFAEAARAGWMFCLVFWLSSFALTASAA
jgi:hypothetical protein